MKIIKRVFLATLLKMFFYSKAVPERDLSKQQEEIIIKNYLIFVVYKT